MVTPAVHFVGFRHPHLHPKDERFRNAVRVFGYPDFIHRGWDHRARREICAGDTVVFAKGDWSQEPNKHAYDDSAEH